MSRSGVACVGLSLAGLGCAYTLTAEEREAEKLAVAAAPSAADPSRVLSVAAKLEQRVRTLRGRRAQLDQDLMAPSRVGPRATR